MLGKPSRRMWLVAIAVSILCVGGLAYALIVDWNTVPSRDLPPAHRVTSGGSGFTIGIVLGIAAGVVLGSLLATRKRD